jgi:hypothetical protein
MKIKGYIVELEPGVYLAPWLGDPPRSCVLCNSRWFGGRKSAQAALERARGYRPFADGKVRKLEIHGCPECPQVKAGQAMNQELRDAASRPASLTTPPRKTGGTIACASRIASRKKNLTTLTGRRQEKPVL